MGVVRSDGGEVGQVQPSCMGRPAVAQELAEEGLLARLWLSQDD